MSNLDAKRAAEALPVVHYDATGKPVPLWPPPVQLRKLPGELQEQILAASAEPAEEEYRINKDLTDFEAFTEEP